MRLRATSIVAWAIALGSACGSDRITVSNSGPPFTYGTITLKDATHGYLVEVAPGNSGPAKVFVHVDANTPIEWGVVADLTIGTTVAVWAESQIPGSEPPEITARQILIYR